MPSGINKTNALYPGSALEYLFRIKDNYSVFQNKTEFKVMVLTPPQSYNPPVAASANDGTSPTYIGKYWCKGRIIDLNMSHELYLPDPCDEAVSENEEVNDLLLSLHSTINIDEYDGFGPGSIITCFIQPGTNNNIYDLQYMQYIKTNVKVTNKQDLSLSECQRLADLAWGSDEGADLLSNSIANSAADFVKRMRDSGYFEGFSDAYLAGVAANAQAESSRFNASAQGDSVSAYPPNRQAERRLQAYNGKCSFGLFQMNICGGAGVSLVNKYSNIKGSNELDDLWSESDKRTAVLTYLIGSNGDYQLRYVADISKEHRALKIFLSEPDNEETAKKAGQFFANYFERCRYCGKTTDFDFSASGGVVGKGNSQTTERGLKAVQIYKAYKQILVQEEVNTLLGTNTPVIDATATEETAAPAPSVPDLYPSPITYATPLTYQTGFVTANSSDPAESGADSAEITPDYAALWLNPPSN